MQYLRVLCHRQPPAITHPVFDSRARASSLVTGLSSSRSCDFRLSAALFSQPVRDLSGLGGGKDEELEDLIEQSLVKPPKEISAEETRSRLTTTRREALSLYRLILRTTRLFVWPNEEGVPWREILWRSARQEFESARFETDPEVVARLLVGGRDAVHQALERFIVKREEVVHGDGHGPPGERK